MIDTSVFVVFINNDDITIYMYIFIYILLFDETYIVKFRSFTFSSVSPLEDPEINIGVLYFCQGSFLPVDLFVSGKTCGAESNSISAEKIKRSWVHEHLIYIIKYIASFSPVWMTIYMMSKYKTSII